MATETLDEPNKSEKPAWMNGWSNTAETMAILRKLNPRLHPTTLIRMRQRGDIEAMQFANRWYYKPESVMPKTDQE